MEQPAGLCCTNRRKHSAGHTLHSIGAPAGPLHAFNACSSDLAGPTWKCFEAQDLTETWMVIFIPLSLLHLIFLSGCFISSCFSPSDTRALDTAQLPILHPHFLHVFTLRLSLSCWRREKRWNKETFLEKSDVASSEPWFEVISVLHGISRLLKLTLFCSQISRIQSVNILHRSDIKWTYFYWLQYVFKCNIIWIWIYCFSVHSIIQVQLECLNVL